MKRTSSKSENRTGVSVMGFARNSRGFTAVETVLALAIAGTFSAIAVPPCAKMIAHSRLNGATRRMAADMMKARAQAVAKNTAIKVSYVDEHTYTVAVDIDGDGTVEPNEVVLTRDLSQSHEGVTLSDFGHTTFGPRGTATGATVTVSGGDEQKVIVVNVVGRVKVQS
jgi:prepilin-type N-terminal cleavage/methylation domain-containing protein